MTNWWGWYWYKYHPPSRPAMLWPPKTQSNGFGVHLTFLYTHWCHTDITPTLAQGVPLNTSSSWFLWRALGWQIDSYALFTVPLSDYLLIFLCSLAVFCLKCGECRRQQKRAYQIIFYLSVYHLCIYLV